MKTKILSTLTLITLILTACGAASTTPQTGPVTQDRTLPVATQLIIGTFKLDDTDQAVTPEQAAKLLPLWQVYQSLGTSDTAAQAELDALVEQIQETMTTEQMQAITDMNLTQQDVMAVMQEQGLGITQRSNTGNSDGSTSPQGGGGFGPPDGFVPGGAPPGEGGGFGGQVQNLSQDQIATAQAARQERSETIVPNILINVLIEFLQAKADL